ncbi:thioredoxin-like protein [Rhodovulum bhavnagarense]|uniref:Thioredoxin-like protein n=1 Tax=Rhodovulum bhavnagarense TaxID=992286 RepID=A0A4R2RGD6_9RHOB|nr:DsbA family protein [Rhodovulum bhavnagarense]TCP61628.1 thioredoxin-like protein [Rhodovulum bhavnagarense]
MIRILTLSLCLIVLTALAGAVPRVGAPGQTLPGAAFAQEAVTVQPFTLGDPDAPITFAEYASFTCGHCADFHDDVFKRLKAEYIDTGKVHFTYQEVYWDRYAIWAGLLARCGGETRFFGLVSMLYEKQREWIDPKDPARTADNLRRIGRTAGLDDAQMDACFNDVKLAEALIARSDEVTKRDGVDGTPSMMIDGELYQNMSYRRLKKILDDKLGG